MNFLFDTSIDVSRRQFYVLRNLYVTYGRRKFHWN